MLLLQLQRYVVRGVQMRRENIIHELVRETDRVYVRSDGPLPQTWQRGSAERMVCHLINLPLI